MTPASAAGLVQSRRCGRAIGWRRQPAPRRDGGRNKMHNAARTRTLRSNNNSPTAMKKKRLAGDIVDQGHRHQDRDDERDRLWFRRTDSLAAAERTKATDR